LMISLLAGITRTAQRRKGKNEGETK